MKIKQIIIIIALVFSLTITVQADWEEYVFGGSVVVESPLYTWQTSLFGGSVLVTLNNAPTNSNPTPLSGAINQELNPRISIQISDINADTMDVTFRTNVSGSWVTIGTNSTVSNGTYSQLPTSFTSFSTKYFWSVNTTDSTNWANNTYNFTTRSKYTPAAPASFSAITINRTIISTTWTDDSNATSTRVEWHTSADSSWDVGDHTLLLNTTLEMVNQTGLSPNTERFYKAWSYNITDQAWSLGSTTSATTNSNNPPTLGTPTPTNNSQTQPLSFSWSIPINDLDADSITWNISCSNGQSNNGVNTNGSRSLSLSGLVDNTTYTVYVNTSDLYNSTNAIFFFKTNTLCSVVISGLSSNRITWQSLNDSIVWSNETNPGGTMQIDFNVTEIGNVSQINILITDLDTNIPKENISLEVSSDNTWSGNTQSFPADTGNLTINSTIWAETYCNGASPFPLTDKTATIYLRFKLNLGFVTPNTYTKDDWKVLWYLE